jgi:hypothetical protein
MDAVCAQYVANFNSAMIAMMEWDAVKGEKTGRLQSYMDAERTLPQGVSLSETQPDLYRDGMAILQACEIHHAQMKVLKDKVDVSRTEGLSAIGTYFGRQMKLDEGSVLERFNRQWVAANTYRQIYLDGKTLCATRIDFDESGPMFKAFARASGHNATDLRKSLDLESSARNMDCEIHQNGFNMD